MTRKISRHLRDSIAYGLEHRVGALEHAMQYARGLDRSKADTFVGMYVNDWTLDFGERGRNAVTELLDRGHRGGVIKALVKPEFKSRILSTAPRSIARANGMSISRPQSGRARRSSNTEVPSLSHRGRRLPDSCSVMTWASSCHNVSPQLKVPGSRAVGESSGRIQMNG